MSLDYSWKIVLRIIFRTTVLLISGLGLGKYLGKLKLVKSIEKSMSRVFNPGFVVLEGHRIYLDKEDSLRLSTFGELNVTCIEHNLFKKFVKEGDIVIDVGAFIGEDTLTLARLVGKKGKVYSFEVDKDNFGLLKKNVEINGYASRVSIYNVAVGNHNGMEVMFKHPFRSNGNKTLPKSTENKLVKWEEYKVSSVKLDSILKKADFMKIDVEGTEPKVILGAKELINSNYNLKIILEFTPSMLSNFNISPTKYLLNFIEMGFDIYDLDKTPIEEIPSQNNLKEAMIGKFTEEYLCHTTNLFLMRRGDG